MFGIGMPELIIILLIALLIFGGKRLRNIGSDLGQAIKGFKKSMGEGDDKKIDRSDEVIESRVAEAEKTKKD